MLGMRYTSVVFLSVLCGIGCTREANPTVRSGLRIASVCPSTKESVGPPVEFTAEPALHASGVGVHMYRFVHAANEMPFWCGNEVLEGYRVVWVPSFRGARLASVVRTKEGWQAEAVEFADPRALPPAALPSTTIANRDHSVPDEKRVTDFLADVDGSKFWTMPGWRTSTETDDGAAWIMEGRKDGVYRMVSRTNVPDMAFENLVRDLFDLARLAIPEEMRSRTHP